MNQKSIPIVIGETIQQQSEWNVRGEFVAMLGDQFYKIKNYDGLAPFFMSIVSSSNHWLFISSTGVHFILFIYNRNFKSNLFFTLFLFAYAVNIFFDYQASLSNSYDEAIIYLRIHRGVVVFNPIFVLLFLYSAFKIQIPKYFWVIASLLLITGFFAVLDPVKNFEYTQYPAIIASREAIRIFIKALNKKIYQAWILVTGFVLLFIFSSYDLLMDLQVIEPYSGILNGYPFGFLCLIIFSSIYLARDFVRTNNIILEKEREAREMQIAQRLLEAEDNRKTKELNEARDIQTGQEKYGMQTFNQSLAHLVLTRQVTVEDAAVKSSNPDELHDLIQRGVGVTVPTALRQRRPEAVTGGAP